MTRDATVDRSQPGRRIYRLRVPNPGNVSPDSRVTVADLERLFREFSQACHKEGLSVMASEVLVSIEDGQLVLTRHEQVSVIPPFCDVCKSRVVWRGRDWQHELQFTGGHPVTVDGWLAQFGDKFGQASS